MKKNPPNTITINNHIKLAISFSDWLLDIILFLLYLFLVLECSILYIRTPIKTPKYLKKLYDRNWNNGFISNITFNTTCPTQSSSVTLATWSGYKKNSCYCIFNNAIFFTEDKSVCKKKTFNKFYSCNTINEISPLNIITYNNNFICITRSTRNISSFHAEFIRKYTEKKSDYKNYYEKVLNGELTIDLLNYVSDISTDGNFTPTINSNPLSIFSFNELFSNIHLENELQCAYNDLSNINPLNQNEGNNLYHLTYNGTKYCNNDSSLYYYNDNGVRTQVLIDNISFSELNSSISNYYNNLNLQISENNSPKIVAEKILYGIGCPYMNSPENHIKKYKYFKYLRRFSLTLSIFSLIIFIIGILFLIFRLDNNCVDSSGIYFFFCFLLIFCLIIAILMSALYLGYGLTNYIYFNKFNKYCQTDFTSSTKNNKALPLEIGLLGDFWGVITICIGTLVLEILILIFLIIYFCNNCYEHNLVFITPEMYAEQIKEFKIHARNVNADREEENKITEKADTITLNKSVSYDDDNNENEEEEN